MTEKTIIRTPKERNYFSVARATAQDSTLSFEARGVLLYLLSKPDDWIVQPADLMREGGIGRDKAKSLLKELREAGYIQTEMLHDELGQFSGKVDRIYEVRQGDRDTEKPSDGESSERQNRSLHNTESLESTENDSADDPAAPSAAPVASKPVAGSAKASESKSADRPQDLIFNAVASVCFELTTAEELAQTGDGGRIGKIAAWIKKTYPGATPKTIEAFGVYYDANNKGISRPRDLTKFKERFIEFHAHVTGGKPPLSANGSAAGSRRKAVAATPSQIPTEAERDEMRRIAAAARGQLGGRS